MLQTKLSESFLILFIDATIDQATERILHNCRKDPVIDRTNRPVEQN